MHRVILQACLPCLIALAVACAALVVVGRISGARFRWKRLREVHACETGGVQSLAFVLTLPLFIIIAQFIVQVSQLMIGIMGVNYAAYAAARSAAVWVPASISWLDENRLGAPITADEPVVLTGNSDLLINHPKYQQIFKAAVLGVTPIAPSRDLGLTLDNSNMNTAQALQGMYALMVPKSQNNSRIAPRINNKLAWAWKHTAVRVSFVDKNTATGPTYNPRMPVPITDPTTGSVTYTLLWNFDEVGWQDPMTFQVTHEFALLPGPGRILANYLVRADGQPDLIAPEINQTQAPSRERVYTVSVWASATATVEGFKPVVSYVQMP